MITPEQLRIEFEGKTVLVTGHTGFKGGWLSEWLLLLGARVVGVALPPNTNPSLFAQLDLARRLDHRIEDIRRRDALARIVLDSQPDYVFHLAAQPLVRRSYAEPVTTYDTNVMGTVHLLDALVELQQGYADRPGKYCSTVFVTTDKCYANREWLYGYREDDALGGYDPYSSSKACAELAIASFRQSFFNPGRPELRVGIASARAGNVIGGGDWACDRIVPDCIRHLQRGDPIPVRNPEATRPWQHVLEPLGGYLALAIRQRNALKQQEAEALARLCSSFNFGPSVLSNRSVEELVREVVANWPGRWTRGPQVESEVPHEAGKLGLSWDKAYHILRWHPVWDFGESIAKTVQWYDRQLQANIEPRQLVLADIRAYQGRSLELQERAACC